MQGLMTSAQGAPEGGSRYDDMPESGPAMGQGQERGDGQQMGQGGNPMDPREASPEQQDQYDRFVATAMNIMYEREMVPRLLQLLEGGGDPVEGLARATVMITARVATAAEESGEKLSGDVLFNAGAEIFNQLADVSDAAGFGNFAEDRDMLEAAYFRALDEFRTLMQQAGRVNQQAAQRDLQGLEAMSERGDLEATLRKLAEDDPRMKQNGGDREPQGEPPPGQGQRQMPRREQPREQQTMRG